MSPGSYNGAFYMVSGIDFSVQDTMDLGGFGSLTTRLLTTFTDQQSFSNCTQGYHVRMLHVQHPGSDRHG